MRCEANSKDILIINYIYSLIYSWLLRIHKVDWAPIQQ